jgi:hypothetical protein
MRLSRLLALFAAVLGLITASSAADGGFLATLSGQEQTDAGLTRLTAEQQLQLNALVGREVSLARQGGVTAFAGTFSSRRQPAERTAAGLDALTPKEIEKLNALVAAAIAAKPVPVTTARRLREAQLKEQRRYETHGEVTFVYGRGRGGREVFGGSVYTAVSDRETGLSVGVGVSRYDGDGWWLPYDYYAGDLPLVGDSVPARVLFSSSRDRPGADFGRGRGWVERGPVTGCRH